MGSKCSHQRGPIFNKIRCSQERKWNRQRINQISRSVCKSITFCCRSAICFSKCFLLSSSSSSLSFSNSFSSSSCRSFCWAASLRRVSSCIVSCNFNRLIVLKTPLSILFHLYFSGLCPYPCFPRVSFTSIPYST